MSESNKLPTLADLNADIETAFKNDQFKSLLNVSPPDSWLKPHPSAKTKKNGVLVPARYLPIDKVEFLLDRIFQEWKVEVLRESQIMQSLLVTIRLHYKNPVTGEWLFQDGLGAQPIQKDAGAPFSIDTVKVSGVQMAAPSAKAYAIKDACDHIGRIFGRDVNREGSLEFVGAYSTPVAKTQIEDSKEDERLFSLMRAAKNKLRLESYKEHCTTPALIKEYERLYKTFN